jgi:AAA family ATP:ADP antiporter
MNAAPPTAKPHGKSPLDRLLSLFAPVQPHEGVTVLLLMVNVFLLLGCYYIVKPVREALILAGEGAEVKSYAAAVMAVLLVFLVPAYGAFASRVNRLRLITWVTLFFIANLVVFYLLGRAKTPHLGVAFFLWVGIFNLMIVAQFWSFANDVYTPEQGKRLFAIVAFGSSLGAIVGAWVAKPLIGALGTTTPLIVAAALLGASLFLTRAVHAREHRAYGAGGRPVSDAEPLGRDGGFQLVLRERYLLLIALLMVVLNVVNTNGEFILGKTLSGAADQLIARGQTGGVDPGEFKGRFIGQFYAGFFTWVNVVSAVVQLFVVSRILKWFGVRAALFALPVIALGGYAVLAVTPIIGLIRTVKVMENATDYSLQNTARQALFLPTSREAKYKAKAAIDTFFVRAGDVLSAGVVFAVTSLALGTTAVAGINIILVLVWLAIVWGIAREHRRLTEPAAAPAGATAPVRAS